MEENKQNYCSGSKQYNRSNSFKKILHRYFYCLMPQIKNELERLVQNINLKCITVKANIKYFLQLSRTKINIIIFYEKN